MLPNALHRCALAAAVALCFVAPAHGVTITVSRTDDSSARADCTLRNAITAINYGNAVLYYGCQASMKGPFGEDDTVLLDPGIANSTITLDQGEIVNLAPLTVLGSGQTIDAGGKSRVLSTAAFLRMYNLTLSGGDAGPQAGGGLYANQAYVVLVGVRVVGNHSASSGGGIAIENGSARFADVVISGNRSDGGNGGGLFVSSAGVVLSDSTLADNAATCAGRCAGGMTVISGTGTISTSTFARNGVVASGNSVAGAIYASDAKLTLVDTTIAANTASGADNVAGAILENQATANAAQGALLTNTTLSDNTATTLNVGAATGGILIGPNGTGRLTLANTIVAGNIAAQGVTAAAPADLAIMAGGATSSHSLLGAALAPAFAGNGNVFSDAPRLSPLGDYGGGTQTLALLGDSPAIDAGSDALALDASGQALTQDQRGSARLVGANVDIGAVEYPGNAIFHDGFGG